MSPRTAIHAPTGAIARQRPEDEVRERREPLRVRVEEAGRASATGDSRSVSRLRLAAAARKTATETTRKARAKPTERVPAGSAREAVRGFAASISRSASRLWAMAALRAPTIARRIFPSVDAVGPAAGREHGGEDREGQREERVRELDHLERRPEGPEDARRRAHSSRAAVGSAVRSPVPVQRNVRAGELEAEQPRARAQYASRNAGHGRGRRRRRRETAARRSRPRASPGACSRRGRASTGDSRKARTSGRRSFRRDVGGALRGGRARFRWRSSRASRRCTG